MRSLSATCSHPPLPQRRFLSSIPLKYTNQAKKPLCGAYEFQYSSSVAGIIYNSFAEAKFSFFVPLKF